MELLKTTFRRKSFLSEVIYFTLNIGLAVAVLAIVRTVESPVPALLLVLLGKWRVFAVRPRYWLANIQANLVDVTVSVSAVMLMYSVSSLLFALWLQIGILVLYIAWLVYLKPGTTKKAIIAQAQTVLLAGTTTIFVISYGWPLEFVVICMAFVGYITARHTLTQFEEDHLQFLSIVWAFVLAQMGWVLSHWVIAYTIPGIDVRIPQAVIIVGLLSFVTFRVYTSYRRYGSVRPADVVLPTVFSVGMAVVLVLFFSRIPVGAL